MKDKEMSKMTAEAKIKEVEQVRHGFQMGSRVGVTELGRSTHWRDVLTRVAAMEVVERNATKAVLLKPETFQAILDYLNDIESQKEELEAEIETMEVDRIYGHRLQTTEFTPSGEDAAKSAIELFRANKEKYRAKLDGDN